MALSLAEADRRRDLLNDRRRMQLRAAAKRRLADQYRAQQAEAELALGAIEAELRQLERLRRFTPSPGELAA